MNIEELERTGLLVRTMVNSFSDQQATLAQMEATLIEYLAFLDQNIKVMREGGKL